jgi:hypothetical protein
MGDPVLYLYLSRLRSQGRFGSLVGGELSGSTTLRMKTEMVFETSVSTKAEPHCPADNPKELLH